MMRGQTIADLTKILQDKVSEVQSTKDVVANLQAELLKGLEQHFNDGGAVQTIVEAQKLLGIESPNLVKIIPKGFEGNKNTVTIGLDYENESVGFSIAVGKGSRVTEMMDTDRFFNIYGANTPEGVQQLSRAINEAIRDKLVDITEKLPG